MVSSNMPAAAWLVNECVAGAFIDATRWWTFLT